ncbi:MAG: methionine--tRNA ligase [Firmicutes bacterium]|nr:methionine--tRNA ligase [Bacillota bacterium]
MKTKAIAKANKNTFYISTPLYYPSGAWHLGHSYTTVCCDAIARFKRLNGYDVFYLTGTDEHGQKIADKAKENSKSPKEFVDGLTDNIKELWSVLDIQYDKFIRTTDDYHIASVQKIFDTLYKQGDIYKGNYAGKYCTPCESFFSLAQLKEGKCPDCSREVKDFEEECYFFKLSKYQEKIEILLKSGEFLLPDFRAKEMINNFIKGGLSDLAVSRASVDWGVKVPFDTKHTVYVWIDALSNYINALGYNGDNKGMDKFWGGEVVHMVGKEIVRFHTIIWPAILMALGLPLPKTVFGHGWLLLEGDKMSKSKGNTADPFYLIDKYGVDAVRYYLLREIQFGNDGVYSLEAFLTRINTDLVNTLGNLTKRTIAMVKQYFGNTQFIGYGSQLMTTEDNVLIENINLLFSKVEKHMNKLNCSLALEEIFELVSAANKYIDVTMPWVLNKNGEKGRLHIVLYNLLEVIRVSANLLLPFIPDGTKRIFECLNLNLPADFHDAKFNRDTKYEDMKDEILYKRIDIKKELEN